MQYRFTLEKHINGKSSKHLCPACLDARKTFTRYIDTATGEPLAEHIGRCDREQKCGYHMKPKDFLHNQPEVRSQLNQIKMTHRQIERPQQQKSDSFHSADLVKKYGSHFQSNGLVKYLIGKIGQQATDTLIDRYKIGTYGDYTVFWQIDAANNIRGGKLIKYNESTGKRLKDSTSWIHSKLRLDQFILKQCLFGEHQLVDTQKLVIFVESEKTAMIASHFFPENIWLATGGKKGLTEEKLKAVQGRTVVLYPDLGAREEWLEKVSKFNHLARFTVSDLLESIATEEERSEGLDIADFLLREFSPELDPLPTSAVVTEKPKVLPLSINDELTALDQYFSLQNCGGEWYLNPYEKINDGTAFVSGHMEFLQSNGARPAFLPYLERLRQFKQVLEEIKINELTSKESFIIN